MLVSTLVVEVIWMFRTFPLRKCPDFIDKINNFLLKELGARFSRKIKKEKKSIR